MRQILFLILLFGACAYVASDAITGSHGLQTRNRLASRVAMLRKELEMLRGQRKRLERDAELLGAASLAQPVLIEQEARSLLDLGRPTDIVIVNDDASIR